MGFYIGRGATYVLGSTDPKQMYWYCFFVCAPNAAILMR